MTEKVQRKFRKNRNIMNDMKEIWFPEPYNANIQTIFY